MTRRTMHERARRSAIGAALLTVVFAALSASAHAGTMRHWVCVTDGGVPTANIAGWVGTNQNAPGGNAYSDCGNANPMGLRADMTAITGGMTNGNGVAYTYTAPSGTTISTARLQIYGVVNGDDQAASMGIVLYRGGQAYDGDHVLTQCQRFTGCTNLPTTAVTYGVNSPVFMAWVGCGTGTPGASCGGGNRGEVRVQRGFMNLVDDTPPTVGGQGGTVMQDVALRGTESFTFSAGDVGVGVSDVEVRIDDTVIVPRQKIDNNDGKCLPVEGGYLWPVPCKTSVAATAQLDTTKVADGAHTLTATVWDAAGNATSAVSRRITVQNTPAPGPGSSELVSNNGQGGDPSTGKLEPKRKRKSARVDYGKTVRVEGRAVDAAGRPLVGAQVDVFEQVQVKGSTMRLIQSLTTDEKGGYSYKSQPRSSRHVEVRYSRQRGANVYQSTHAVKVAVRAKVTLSAKRTSIPSYGTVVLRGRVLVDDLASGGTLVQVRARDGNRWLKVGTPRTDASGRFEWKWKFKRVRHGAITFQVRLLRTGDLPAETNVSRNVRVRIG